MTRFGKLLIFLNLFLSITFAGWAAGVYTQRIDWAPARTLAGETIADRPGRVKELDDKIKALVELRDLAETRWQASHANVASEEQHRSMYQDWYAQELTIERTGLDGDAKPVEFPVRVLVHDKNTGDLDMAPVKDKAGAVDVNGEPLKSIEYYDERYKELKKKIDDLQKQYAQKVQEAEEQAVAINGIPDKLFGLRDRVRQLNVYLHNANDERAYLQPLYDSTTAELNTMRKRNLALKTRLKELTEFAAAQR